MQTLTLQRSLKAFRFRITQKHFQRRIDTIIARLN